MRVKAVAVPLVDCGGASFGAVCNDKEEFAVYLEGLHIIWFPYLEDINILDPDELASRDIPFVDVGATKQLGHNDEQLVINNQWFANHSGDT